MKKAWLALLIILFLPVVCASQLTTDLLGYWAAEEASGSLVDSTDMSNDLTVNGTPTYQVGGFESYAVNLTGADNFYLLSGDFNGDFTPASLTLNIWLKATVLAQNGGLFAMGEAGANDVAYQTFFPNTVGYYSHVSTNGAHASGTTHGNCAANKWYMMTTTWNGSHMKVFVNGTKINTVAVASMHQSSGNFYLGLYYDQLYKFKGSIDEIGVWNRSLSDSEVSDVYKNATSGVFYPWGEGAAPSNPTVHWHPTNWLNATTNNTKPLISFFNLTGAGAETCNLCDKNDGTCWDNSGVVTTDTKYNLSATLTTNKEYQFFVKCLNSSTFYNSSYRYFTYDNIPPSFSKFNCTSCSPPAGDATPPYSTNDTTPTFTVHLESAGACRIDDANGTYAAMGATRNCSHVNTSILTCTVGASDALTPTTDYAYVACEDTVHNMNVTSLEVDLSSLAYWNSSTLYLHGLNKSIDAELGSLINVTCGTSVGVCYVDINHPEYGVNVNWSDNLTDYVVNISSFFQTKFNDSTTSKILTSSGKSKFVLDNRSTIISAKLNLSSGSHITNLLVAYDNQIKRFNGVLWNKILNDSYFVYEGSYVNATTITFSTPGNKRIYFNMTEHPRNLSFKLWGSSVDLQNNLTFVERFNNSDYINSTSSAEFPLWNWDDFSTNTRTSLYTSGVGTYTGYVNTTNQRYEGSSTSTDASCGVLGEKTDSDSAVMVTLLQNISRFKRISFYGYCYAMASCYVAGGMGSSNAEGKGTCEFILSSSSTASSYITIPAGSANTGWIGCDQAGESDSRIETVSGTYILERVQDSGSTHTFRVFKDESYVGLTSSLSGDINLGYTGGTGGNCKNTVGGAYVNGYGWHVAYFDTVKYSGAANNYTANLTYEYNSTVESVEIYEAPTNISAITLDRTEYKGSGCDIDYFVSATNGTVWESAIPGIRHLFVNRSNRVKWRANMSCADNNDTAAVIEVSLTTVPGDITNVSVDLLGNGVMDWSFNKTLNGSNSPQIVSFDSTNLEGHEGYYRVYIFSSSAGEIELNESVLSSDINRVSLNITALETCDNCVLEINFTGDNVTVDDLRIEYLGGNQTFEVKAHSTSYEVNVSRNITFYYSDWNYSFPNNVYYLEFIPGSPTSKNVAPYGQVSSIPILNISALNYDSLPYNFSMYLNESFSCVNLTVSNQSASANSTLVSSGSWNELGTGQSYGEYFGIYLWANYSCNFSSWNLWEPEFSFRACCSGCICDEGI